MARLDQPGIKQSKIDSRRRLITNYWLGRKFWRVRIVAGEWRLKATFAGPVSSKVRWQLTARSGQPQAYLVVIRLTAKSAMCCIPFVWELSFCWRKINLSYHWLPHFVRYICGIPAEAR